MLDDRFILSQRGPRRPLDPWQAHASFREEEPDATGVLVPTAVVFLTNRECPFRCVMCDLWANTLEETVPPGAVPRQIRDALTGLGPVRQAKLYNAGSYFDPQAIPPDEDAAVARELRNVDRVVVEAHPAFLAGAYGDRCLRFRDRLGAQLEVAIGLETAHPDVLARLNKKMTLESFRRAADFLHRHDIALRVFVLLSPPYMPDGAAVEWACRSIDVAAESGATVCAVIPTRGGNGAMEAIGDAFRPPRLRELEAAVEYGLSRGDLRVFADLWDVDRFVDCACSPTRVDRLRVMNREQRPPASVVCACDDRH